MVTDEHREVLEPLIQACRPHTRRLNPHLRRTISQASREGEKWRSIPVELGPRWMAGQTFIRWSRPGV